MVCLFEAELSRIVVYWLSRNITGGSFTAGRGRARVPDVRAVP